MSTAAKVGGFFLVALVLTGLMIWKIEDLRFGKAAGRTLTLEFDNVAGLKDKADVRLAGVRVGRVSRVRLVGGRAVVDLEISADVALREGASAAIQSLGMLGDKYVELDPGPPGGPALREGATLQGEAPANFDEITKLARDIEGDIREVTKNLKDTLGVSGDRRLNDIVDNVLAMSRETRKLIESNRSNIDVSTANFREFSTEMTKLVERIDKLVASNQTGITQTVDNAKELSTKLQATVDNMNAITGQIRKGEGTIGKLVKSEETDKNLNDALVAVKDGVKSLTTSMDTVKKWDVDLGLRGEYLSRFEKTQGFFTFDLIPRDKPRFYRLEISSEPFGIRKETTHYVTVRFPDGHTESLLVNDVEYKQDTAAISAEVAFRLGQFTGRAGVIENTGGVGVDYQTLKNRLMLSAQFWNFSRADLNPQAKITGRYYFSPSVFLTGGWNDFLNTKNHLDSAFVGAGVRWGDNDAKYLAGSVPIH